MTFTSSASPCGTTPTGFAAIRDPRLRPTLAGREQPRRVVVLRGDSDARHEPVCGAQQPGRVVRRPGHGRRSELQPPGRGQSRSVQQLAPHQPVVRGRRLEVDLDAGLLCARVRVRLQQRRRTVVRLGQLQQRLRAERLPRQTASGACSRRSTGTRRSATTSATTTGRASWSPRPRVHWSSGTSCSTTTMGVLIRGQYSRETGTKVTPDNVTEHLKRLQTIPDLPAAARDRWVRGWLKYDVATRYFLSNNSAIIRTCCSITRRPSPSAATRSADAVRPVHHQLLGLERVLPAPNGGARLGRARTGAATATAATPRWPSGRRFPAAT